MIDLPEFDSHETVVSVFDQAAGLRGFIAIHNTARGPATGGTRYALYSSETDALRDALRLSRAMTYKCALADVPYGGGKAVIIGDSQKPKSKALLRAYAKQINLLGGNFYTGQDVGITNADIAVMRGVSPFIGSKAGDLGRWAALGVFCAMQSAAEELFGLSSLRGRKIAVKGLGKLGFPLCELIHRAGAHMIIADIDPVALKRAKRAFPEADIASSKNIHRTNVDMYSPCAFGGEFGEATIAELRCSIICGGANNQLVTEADGMRLHGRGIVYVPDYLANAGGLIGVMDERNPGGYNQARVTRKIKKIGETARTVIRRSRKEKKPASEVADRMAESIFQKKKAASRR